MGPLHHQVAATMVPLLAARPIASTADFPRFGPPQPLPVNHLLCENCRTQGRIGEVGLIAAALARVGRPVAHCVRAVPSLCPITRFSARTDSSPRDSPSSAQKISTLCSPISGARREIRQGEPL